MKPFKTEAIYMISSCLFLIGICDTAQSRPCSVVQKSHCDKCTSVDNCYDSDESEECNWCCECSRGTYVIEHCSENDPTSTKCAPCPDNTFSSLPNHQLSCNASKPPDSCIRLVNTKFVPGDSFHDNRCACKEGYFAENAEIDGCKPHLECPDGFGVVRLGNGTHDTECKYCELGFCSNVTSATEECQPCDGSSGTSTGSTSVNSAKITSTATTIVAPGYNSITAPGVGLGLGIMFALACLLLIALLCYLRRTKKNDKKKRLQRKKEKEIRKKEKRESRKKLLSNQDGSGTGLIEMDSRGGERGSSEQPSSQSPARQQESGNVGASMTVEGECLNTASPDYHVERFKTNFRDYGYEVMYEPTRDDNDRMFQAIAYLLISGSNPSNRDVADKASQLRRYLVSHLTQNDAHYRNRDTSIGWNEYINAVRTDSIGDEIMIEGISHVISRNIQVIASNGTIVNQHRVDNADGSDILIGYVDNSVGDNDYNNYYVTLHRMESEPNRGDELEEVCVRHPGAGDVNGGVPGEQQLQDRATSSDAPPSNSQQANLSQPPNTTSQNASGIDDSLQQQNDAMQDSIEDAPTPSVLPEVSENVVQSNVSVHHDLQDVDESTPLMQQQSEDSVHPEQRHQSQANGEPDGITQSVPDDLQDVDESTAFIQQQTDDSVQPEPQRQGRTSENRSGIRQPPDPLTSAASEPPAPSHEESQASGQDPASSSQRPPTSEEVAGATNSAQDHATTAVKVPVVETVTRRMFQTDLALFKSSSNQEELKKVSTNPDILHQALKSPEYLEAMCDYLIDRISSSDLKAMLRTLQLLDDITIEDIEMENPKDSREQRRLFCKKMQYSQGDKINPRILLDKMSEYSMRKPYDDLCKGFVKHFKRSSQQTTT